MIFVDGKLFFFSKKTEYVPFYMNLIKSSKLFNLYSNFYVTGRFLIDCERLMTLCIGNLDSRVTEKDVEDEFHVFGVIRK